MKIRSKAKIENQVAKRVEKELELKSKEVQHAKEIAAWKIQEAQREAAHAIEKRFILEDRKTREAFDAVLHSKRDYKVDSGQEGRNKQIQEIKKEINSLKKSLTLGAQKVGVASAPLRIKKISKAWGTVGYPPCPCSGGVCRGGAYNGGVFAPHRFSRPWGKPRAYSMANPPAQP